MSKKVKKHSLPYQTRKEVKESVNKLVKSQTQNLIKEMQQNATEQVVWKFGTVMCWVLHKRLDWNKEELNWILGEVTFDFEAMCENYVSFEDITQALFEETGLDLRALENMNTLPKEGEKE